MRKIILTGLIILVCFSCRKKKQDVSCEAVVTVTNHTGQTLNYSWNSNAYDQLLGNGASASMQVGHIDIKYSQRGQEITHTSYNVSFETSSFTESIEVNDCNVSRVLN